MSYIPFEDYTRKWIFSHASMPVDAAHLEFIKPLSQAKAAQIWLDNVSRSSPDSQRLAKEDWPLKANCWQETVNWMAQWEEDGDAMPDALSAHFDWQDDVTVYFCYDKYQAIETQWWVFRRYWKNFLFYDDGPILLGRRRKQTAWFFDNGDVKLGMRP